MNCPSYQSLTPEEEIVFIGQLVVAAQRSEKCFKKLQEVIKLAAASGAYDRVTIQPTGKGVSEALSDLDNPMESSISGYSNIIPE